MMGDEEITLKPNGVQKRFFLLLLWAQNSEYLWWGSVEGGGVLGSSGACGVHLKSNQTAGLCTRFSGLCLNCSATRFSQGMQS